MENINLKYEYLLEMIEKDGEMYIEREVPSFTLGKIVNAENLVQVADSIIVFTYGATFIIQEDHFKERKDVEKSFNEKFGRVIPVRRITYARADFDQCDDTQYTYKRKKYKTSGEMELTDALYIEIGTRVKHRKKGLFGAWYYKNSPEIWMSGVASWKVVTCLSCLIPPTAEAIDDAFFDHGYNEAEKQHVFWNGVGNEDPYFTAYDTDHWAKQLNNTTGHCGNNF